MDANTWTLEKLFDAPIRYLVPLYQRPYVWSRSRQWEPLWTDLRGLAERWLDHASAGLNADAETSPHFLGAVVLEQIANATGTLELRNVIDGQQRLTTLQLLLDAVGSIVSELGDVDDADLLRDLVRNTKKTKSFEEQFKVWPTNVDREAFVAAMDDESDRTAHADSRLVECYLFFREASRLWALQDGSESAPERLHGLTVALLGRVQIVVIDLEAGDDPQVIFETLNDRGEPLLAGDLVKNEILRRVSRESGEPAMEACYSEYWRQFDTDPFWRLETKQGRFKRPRLDVFLFHWLTLRSGQLASVGQEFLTFRKYVAAQELKITDVARDVYETAKTWRRLEEEPRTTAIGMSLNRLNALDAGLLRPLTLFIFNDVDLDSEQHLQALRIVESWAVRRAICKLPSMGMNRFVVDLVGRITKVPAESVVESLRGHLAGQTTQIAHWPTDKEVFDALVYLPLYGRVSQARVRLVLEALENLRRSSKTEEPAPESLTIEHVLPRGWTQAAWPLPADDPNGDARNLMINTLGNLTLLTGALNSSQSNGKWEAKRIGLKQSVLRLNRELDELETWDEATSAARGRRLAKEVLDIWPRPCGESIVAAAATEHARELNTEVAFDEPRRPPTQSETLRASNVIKHDLWGGMAALVTSWARVVFPTEVLANAGQSWGVTAAPGAGRLLAVHLGGREALTVHEGGSVELLAAGPIASASDSSTTVGVSLESDDFEETSCEFFTIESARAALNDPAAQREIVSWAAQLTIGPIPLGYSNSALVGALEEWDRMFQARPTPSAD